MLIAAQKYEDNIAEYVLYMWHIEDMVRACNFSIELIRQNIIAPQTDDEALKQKIEDWYMDLMRKMKNEGIETKGHLAEVNDVLIEMFYLHNSLLNVTNDKKYIEIFETAHPYIKEFGSKANATSLNPLEICLNAQYAKLLLKIQKKTITPESEEAFKKFRDVLAYIAARYKEMKTGAYTAMSN